MLIKHVTANRKKKPYLLDWHKWNSSFPIYNTSLRNLRVLLQNLLVNQMRYFGKHLKTPFYYTFSLVQDRREKEHGGGGGREQRNKDIFTTCHSTGKGLPKCFYINAPSQVSHESPNINIHCEPENQWFLRQFFCLLVPDFFSVSDYMQILQVFVTV